MISNIACYKNHSNINNEIKQLKRQRSESDSENENSVLSEAEKDDLKAQLEESLGRKELKKKLAMH